MMQKVREVIGYKVKGHTIHPCPEARLDGKVIKTSLQIILVAIMLAGGLIIW